MGSITVICEECDERIDGIIGSVPTPRGDKAAITSGGFYVTEEGAVCDSCAGDEL